MKLSKEQRESIRMMFGGRCAYCGCELGARWHADHVEAVERAGSFVSTGNGFSKWKPNGKLRKPENDWEGNLFPSCIKCNILKSSGNIETLRSTLTYFASSIPTIRTYSHVHHLVRFNRLHIDPAPVTFWFEKYATHGSFTTNGG